MTRLTSDSLTSTSLTNINEHHQEWLLAAVLAIKSNQINYSTQLSALGQRGSGWLRGGNGDGKGVFRLAIFFFLFWPAANLSYVVSSPLRHKQANACFTSIESNRSKWHQNINKLNGI